VKAWLFNLNEPKKQTELAFLVDSGAIYTVIPRRIAEDIGIIAHSSRVFELADGRKVTWPVGNAGFRIGDHQGASIVIFGEETLLGITALETLGLGLDPVRKELVPIPLPLM
jgi:aspartyl protease family protein